MGIGSGCTNHMCFNKDKFQNLHKHKNDFFVIGDDTKIEFEGIGNIIIEGILFEDVLYVPKLRKNLISVFQICKKGHTITFNATSWSIKKGFLPLLSGHVQNNLYVVSGIPSKVCLATNVSSSSKLWHHRLGHTNYQNLSQMK